MVLELCDSMLDDGRAVPLGQHTMRAAIQQRNHDAGRLGASGAGGGLPAAGRVARAGHPGEVETD